jgi:drug/metabolite transporter (DMT)-like permease
MKSASLRAAGWMILAQALFAVMSVGARFVGPGVPWQEVCGSRMATAAALSLLVARLRGSSLRIVDKKHAWLRSAFGTLAAGGTFYVLSQPSIAVGDAVTLFATSPIFVVLLSWPILGERVRRSVVLAILAGFAGIVVVARPSFSTAAPVVVVGMLTALAAAMAMMWLRKIGPGESSEAIVFHFMCVGATVMALASIPVWRTPDARAGLAMLVTGLSGGFAQLSMTRAYAIDVAARVSAVGYAGIVLTRLLALPVFGEVPTLVQAAGSALVMASGVLVAWWGRRPQASASRISP